MILKIKKQGELTTQQIVIIVILMASFSVILFLLFRLNLGEQTNAEICHNSVILKEKSVIGGSLNCRTSYVCISGGENCKDIIPTKTIKVDANNKQEIMKAIADQMAECWWMFGEGKVDYAGTKDSALGKNICAACSILKFDRTINENAQKITYEELITKGLLKPKNTQETYLSYLYDVNSPEELYKKDISGRIENDAKNKKEINFEEKYMVRTGLAKGALFDYAKYLGFESDKIILPYFFETNNIPNPQCDEFITKA
ncbi:hypothetical protein HY448_02205 [Candidatus Pacearchaeota archaeon]|nr:hypothetical protein [Candidatus Pacearchaeota archaeon]